MTIKGNIFEALPEPLKELFVEHSLRNTGLGNFGYYIITDY